MENALESLLQSTPLLWRGRGSASRSMAVWPTGFAELDGLLPGGGWPRDGLLELLVPQWGIGELQLLLPALAAASGEGQRLVLIAPPYIPYAPALAAAGVDLNRLLLLQPSGQGEIAWAMEQALRQAACAMVLAWPGQLKAVMVRRLQLAAEAGQSLGILLLQRDWGGSPAALRLRLRPRPEGLQVQILKSRASCRRQSIDLPLV